MPNKKPPVKNGEPTPAARELEAKREAQAQEETIKRKKAKAAIEAEMKTMNQNPQITVREVFDPAGNQIQRELEISPRESSLVEFDQDSKGKVKPRVKIYHEDPGVAFKLALDLMKKAVKEAAKMSAKMSL